MAEGVRLDENGADFGESLNDHLHRRPSHLKMEGDLFRCLAFAQEADDGDNIRLRLFSQKAPSLRNEL